MLILQLTTRTTEKFLCNEGRKNIRNQKCSLRSYTIFYTSEAHTYIIENINYVCL